MTNQELIDYYADLLILQYRGKEKARATIQALTKLVIMDQLPVAVQDAFGVQTAVGAQLDVIGKYAGASRSGYGSDGPITLDDDDYRKLILLQIIKNNSGSSLYDINYLLNLYFPGLIRVTDNATMQLNYYLNTDLGSADLLSMIIYNGFLPAPMGVQISTTVVPPHTENFFGFRTYELPPFQVSPFNTYELYLTDTPFLTYEDAIIF